MKKPKPRCTLCGKPRATLVIRSRLMCAECYGQELDGLVHQMRVYATPIVANYPSTKVMMTPVESFQSVCSRTAEAIETLRSERDSLKRAIENLGFKVVDDPPGVLHLIYPHVRERTKK